jgi:hypothetical protein
MCYFGYQTEILYAFERYRGSIIDNNRLTRLDRHLLLTEIDKLHQDCKHVLNYAAKNIEFLSKNLLIVGPLAICGLPRSGAILLYN